MELLVNESLSKINPRRVELVLEHDNREMLSSSATRNAALAEAQRRSGAALGMDGHPRVFAINGQTKEAIEDAGTQCQQISYRAIYKFRTSR